MWSELSLPRASGQVQFFLLSAKRSQVHHFFGSLPRSVYTLFQTTLGGISWYEVTDALAHVDSMSFALMFAACHSFEFGMVPSVGQTRLVASLKNGLSNYFACGFMWLTWLILRFQPTSLLLLKPGPHQNNSGVLANTVDCPIGQFCPRSL